MILRRFEKEGHECVWRSTILRSCSVSIRDRRDMELSSVKSMNIMQPPYKVVSTLQYVYLLSDTVPDHDYSLLTFGSAPVKSREAGGTWNDADPFGSVIGLAHVY